MRLFWLTALFLLAACAADDDQDQPLTYWQFWTRLAGHTVEATDSNGQRYHVRLATTGVATITGGTAEFGQWHTDERNNLCLRKFEGPEVCAPLYQLNVAHYRWGETVLTVLDL